MFAKLFSRITESSLMEEPLEVRYVFVMLLAICDSTGHVIGTDVAIARRMNVSPESFRKCAEALMQPDSDSNSKVEEGRRIVASQGERGYHVVNYLTYREMKTTEQRREYMKAYMKQRRETQRVKQGVNKRKQKVAVLGHAEEEAEEEKKPPISSECSEVGKQFSDWFRKLLPDTANLVPTYRAQWAKCYDDMIRLDGRDKDSIKSVCEWAKADNFWGKNFQSPLKLRARNEQGAQYFDVFSAAMTAPKKPEPAKEAASYKMVA